MGERTRIIVVLMALMAVLSPRVWADEIVLLEGKVIVGKIIDETEDAVTVQSGKSMILTIAKSKIQKINRPDTSSQRKGPIITMDDVNRAAAKKPSSPTPMSSIPVQSPSPSQPLPPNVPQIPGGDTKTRQTAIDNVVLNEWVVRKSYPVKGRTAQNLAEAIFDIDKGKGFLQGRERLASQTKFAAAWSGESVKDQGQFRWKALVIRSTATVTSPAWDKGANADPALTQKWNELQKAINEHMDAEIKVYVNAIALGGKKMGQMQASTEADLKVLSNQIFKESLTRAENQKLGLNRRRKVDWPKILGLAE